MTRCHSLNRRASLSRPRDSHSKACLSKCKIDPTFALLKRSSHPVSQSYPYTRIYLHSMHKVIKASKYANLHISVEDLHVMQCLESHDHLNEYVPYFILLKEIFSLLIRRYLLEHIPVICVFHHYTTQQLVYIPITLIITIDLRMARL